MSVDVQVIATHAVKQLKGSYGVELGRSVPEILLFFANMSFYKIIKNLSENPEVQSTYPRITKITEKIFMSEDDQQKYGVNLPALWRELFDIYIEDERGAKILQKNAGYTITLAFIGSDGDIPQEATWELFTRSVSDYTDPIKVTGGNGLFDEPDLDVAAHVLWVAEYEDFQDLVIDLLKKSKSTPSQSQSPVPSSSASQKSEGCYIATAVYGTYDCPEVWMLRRFRDNTLKATFAGRAFIKTYYAISPWLVRNFKNSYWFMKPSKHAVNRLVKYLGKHGVSSEKYKD